MREIVANKITINEAQLKKILVKLKEETSVGYGCFTFDNTFGLHFSGKLKLDEGLVKTYPIDVVEKYTRNYLGLTGDKEGLLRRVKNAQGGESLQFFIFEYFKDYDAFISRIEKVMALCGYSLSFETTEDDGRYRYRLLQYEPKFENVIDVKKWKTIAHITPERHLKKILENGFSPRWNNNLFKYPPRVYFFKGDISSDKVIGMARSMDNANGGKNEQYVFLMVDTSKIPENVRFFADTTYESGIFTYENIPANVIDSVYYVPKNV